MDNFYQFPNVNEADDDGVLAIGGNLDAELLLSSYVQGIFPWPMENYKDVIWFAPDPRGIILIKDLHIPKSFKRFLNNNPYTIKFNNAFEKIIELCANTPRLNQAGTWITSDIKKSYLELLKKKFAYSVEIYNKEKLVAGLYGVIIGNYLSAESMFHLESNTSKLALYTLIQQMKINRITWLDTQMISPVVESFGGIEIPRAKFMDLLSKCQFNSSHYNQIFSTTY